MREEKKVVHRSIIYDSMIWRQLYHWMCWIDVKRKSKKKHMCSLIKEQSDFVSFDYLNEDIVCSYVLFNSSCCTYSFFSWNYRNKIGTRQKNINARMWTCTRFFSIQLYLSIRYSRNVKTKVSTALVNVVSSNVHFASTYM
jgi:hypothetical protein